MVSKVFRLILWIFILKDDNVGSFLMFLGIIFYNLGLVYLIECLLYVVVLNLGIINFLLCKVYFVLDFWNRLVIYLGYILFLILYMRVVMFCNFLFCKVYRLVIFNSVL